MPPGSNKISSSFPRKRESSLNRSAFLRQSGANAVFVYPTLPSTNDEAKRLAEEGALDRSLVITNRQTAGRGRASNRWWSGPGTLTFSVILKPPVASVDAGLVSLVAGLAVVRGIRDIVPDFPCGVKWPNDIYATGKKIGGILTESSVRRGRTEHYVIGIGLNVNTSLRGAPADVRARAASLRSLSISKRRWDETRVLAGILESLSGMSGVLFRRGFPPFLREWKRTDVIGAGTQVVLVDGTRHVSGSYEGILETGEVRLRDETDRVRPFRAGSLLLGVLVLGASP